MGQLGHSSWQKDYVYNHHMQFQPNVASFLASEISHLHNIARTQVLTVAAHPTSASVCDSWSFII